MTRVFGLANRGRLAVAFYRMRSFIRPWSGHLNFETCVEIVSMFRVSAFGFVEVAKRHR
jgi:hypothetical protein